jgi:type IV pilus assembly protein PilY1
MKRLSIADRVRAGGLAAMLAAGLAPAWAATPLADQPVFSTIAVPGNLALALSVEFPTAISVAHYRTATYDAGEDLPRLFRPRQVLSVQLSRDRNARHFYPAGQRRTAPASAATTASGAATS